MSKKIKLTKLERTELRERKLVALIGDTTAHGMPHHDHNKHCVEVRDLTFCQAMVLTNILNKKIFRDLS